VAQEQMDGNGHSHLQAIAWTFFDRAVHDGKLELEPGSKSSPECVKPRQRKVIVTIYGE